VVGVIFVAVDLALLAVARAALNVR